MRKRRYLTRATKAPRRGPCTNGERIDVAEKKSRDVFGLGLLKVAVDIARNGHRLRKQSSRYGGGMLSRSD